MKGTPVIYYGDEIGMGDNVYLGDRNGVRTPMQWTGDRNAGFSRADVHALYAPLVADPVYGYQAVNVEAQERVPGIAPELDEAADPRPSRAPGLRARHARVPAPGEPARARLPARARGRDGPVRRQPQPLRPVRRARPLALRRPPAGRDDRPRPLPAHRRPAVPAHPGTARLLLVRADRWQRAEPATVRLATPADAEALGAVSGRAWRATYPGIVPDAVLDEWIEEAPDGLAPGASPTGRRTARGGRGSPSGTARSSGYATTSPGEGPIGCRRPTAPAS